MKFIKASLFFVILFIFYGSFIQAQSVSSVVDLEKQKAKAVAEENYPLAGQLSKQIKEQKAKDEADKIKLAAEQQRRFEKAKEIEALTKEKKAAVATEDYAKAMVIQKKIKKLTEIDDLEKEKRDAIAEQDYEKAGEIHKRLKFLKEEEEIAIVEAQKKAERDKQIAELDKQKKVAVAKEDFALAGEINKKILNLKEQPVSGGQTAQVSNVQIVQAKYDTGELLSETPMVNGKVNGVVKMYYKNGKLQAETSFKDGVINGNQKSYGETGRLLMETEWADNKINGIQRVYDLKDGHLLMESEYRNNKTNGKNRLYDEKGQAIQEMNYVDGVVVGSAKFGAKNISQTKLSSQSSAGRPSSYSPSSSSSQIFSSSSSGSVVYTKSEKSKIRQSEDNTTAGIKYRRSSLYTMMINDESRPYANVIAQSFVDSPLPTKFNDHDLNEKAIPAAGSRTDQFTNIDNYLNTNAVAKAIVAKWFNRTDKGTFNMDLVAQRGNYNASAADFKLAILSSRGNALLSDAGEDLIGNTFVVINDFGYTNKEEVAKKAKAGLGILSLASSLAGGPDLSAVNTIGSAALTVAGKGYIIKNTSYLYRLEWTEEVAAIFYKDYWMDDATFDAAKKSAFENSNIFTLKYIGQESAIADLQSNVFTSKTEEELIARATIKAVDAGISKLQRKYEEFRTKTPLYTADPPTAKIGTKEGIEAGDRFEVLEGVQDASGKLIYERKGIITATKDIWDNQFEVGESPNASGNQFTTFKGAGTFYSGMLLKQIR